jgi:hypothetical protein
MIVIKHRQTDKETYCATEWFYKQNIDLGVYEIVSWEDVVEVFDKYGSHGKMEKHKAIELIDSRPGGSLQFKDVPRPDLREFATKKINEVEDYKISHLDLDTNRPIIAERIHPLKTVQNGIGSFKKWGKTLSVKVIVEMIIAGIVVGVIVAILIYYSHLNAVKK